MRYPDGGGLTAAGRARRQAVRLQAAEWFDQDMAVSEIAKRLRVSENAVYRWRRQWRADGEAGLVSKGASGADCRLSSEQQDQLAAALREGPAAHGWVEDQRWTLAQGGGLDRPTVWCPVHAARSVISVAPHGVQSADAQASPGRT